MCGTDGFTTSDGAFALLPASQLATDIGTWVHFDQRSYTVPAGKRLDIPFRLSVPTNATPGDHAGGVITSISQVRVAANSQQVNVDRRIAARIYLRVAGPTQPTVAVETVQVSYDNPVNPMAAGRIVLSGHSRRSSSDPGSVRHLYMEV